MRLKQFYLRTEEAYWSWIRRNADFFGKPSRNLNMNALVGRICNDFMASSNFSMNSASLCLLLPGGAVKARGNILCICHGKAPVAAGIGGIGQNGLPVNR
jgi:hypothetical protein